MRTRKFLALLMAGLMLFGNIVPIPVHAEETDSSDPEIVQEANNDSGSVTEQEESVPAAKPTSADEKDETPISEDISDFVEVKVSNSFDQTANISGVIISVTAPRGVFPDGSMLYVEAGSTKASTNAEAMAEKMTSSNKAVAYTFDIKILDEEGNEIQPNTENGEVSVTFALEAPVKYDDVEVYHVEDELGQNVTPLDTTVEESGDQIEATATTEGFSLFVVQFVYGDLEFDLTGYDSVLLSTIQNALGIPGVVTSAVSSNTALFSAHQISENDWVITSHQSFKSEETLTLEIGNATYVINVYDPVMEKVSASFGNNSDIDFDTYIHADDTRWWSGRVYPNYGALQLHRFKETGEYVYCIETGAGSTDGNMYSEAKEYAQKLVKTIHDDYPTVYSQLAHVAAIATGMINSSRWSSYSDVNIAGAAQIIVWELISGARSSFAVGSTTWVFNKIDAGDVSVFQTLYAEIVRQVANWTVIPSFAGTTTSVTPIKLNYNSSTKKYTATVTDSNGVYSAFSSLGTSGTVPGTSVTYTVSGNSVTFTASEPFTEKAVSSALSKFGTGATEDVIVGYGDVNVSGTGREDGQILIAATGTADVTAYLAFEMDVFPVKVEKTSSNTASYYVNNPLYTLQGAVYGLYASQADASQNKNRLETLTTDANGNATSTGVYAVGQTLYLKEITAPAGYLLNDVVTPLTVSATTANNVFNVKDDPVKDPNRITLQKVNSDGTRIPVGNGSLQGAIFKLNYYMADSATGTPAWTAEFVSDANGRVVLDQAHLKAGYTIPYETNASGEIQFPLGYVTIKETSAPSGYKPNPETITGQIVQKTSGGPASFEPKNPKFSQEADGTILVTEEELTYSLTVTKKDTELSQARAGAEYDIINRSANLVIVNGTSYAVGAVVMHIGPTGSDGKATTGTVLPMGTYGIKETKAPAGLTLNTTETKVTITNANVDKDFENDAQKGTIKIVKKVETAPSGYSIPAPSLAGFQFRVQGTTTLGTSYDKTFTTDSTGIITIPDLLVGSYKVTEVSNSTTAPYIIPAMQENDVTNGATATFTFTNVYKKFKVELTKTAEGSTVNVWSGTSLAGAEYTLYKDGVKVKTYTIDANGKFTTDVFICGEGWTIKETKAPQGFALDPTVYTIGEVQASQDTEVRTDEVTSDDTVLPGTIVIQKKLETAPTGYAIENITLNGFQFKVEGTQDDGKTYSKTFTTDTNGKITVEDLKPGTYTVIELANGKTTPFIIPERQEKSLSADKTVTYTFTNTYKKFNVELKKIAQGSSSTVTVDWPGTSLAGAEYTLYKNGVEVATFTTDSNGKFTTGYYICGEGWTIKETKAPKGFELDPKEYPIGAVDPSQDKENRTDTVTSPETVTPGTLKIEKKFEAVPAGYEVTAVDKSGFQFRITATLADGTTYDKTFTTDADGKITVEDLKPGTYTVIELANGKTTPYLIPDPQEETIEAGKTVTYTFNQVRKKFELTLTKVDKYGKSYPDFPLSGAEYTVYKNGVAVKTYTTDAEGKLTTDTFWEDTGWTIKETKAPNGYQPDPKEYSFGTVDSAQSIEVKNVKLTSEEEPKPADITITKVFENLSNAVYVLTDTNKAGFKFHITGTLDNGETYDKTFETDENGQVILTGLIPGTYTIEEIEVPGITDNYLLPEPQTFTVLPQDEMEKEFDQTYKKFRFMLTKVDADGLERTEASLAGAEYTLYKGGVAVKTYTTDENGQFTSDVYVCDSDYVVKETKASEGYKLDETEYPVGKVEGTQEIEIRNDEIKSREEVVTGKIMINKVTDEGIEAEIIPEEGAQFEIYLRAAGSYDAALETERDILTINKYGYATSKELPYGTYTVHQTYSWDGRKLTDDFDVVVGADSDPDEPYYYLLENETFRSYIKVVKTDAETGETIPFAGATFEICDESDEPVTIQITYPSRQTLTSFVTDESGTFITPIRLPYGEYTLKEIKAPEGYVLYTEPIPFTVNEENAQEDEGLMLITITVPNGPEKGQLTVSKEGEVFSTVKQDGDLYIPVYEVKPLAGATFEITAATDIYTPDGTLRAKKGEVVDTITTGEDGTATSVELYLGKYEVREVTAPYGMVLNEEVQTVEFTYGGQDVEVVFEQASFKNDRQKYDLSILKEMKADEDGNIDLDAALMNVEFSLYAREELVAADGKTIPADGLLAQASPDEEGKIVFNVDLLVDAKVYVKETATDSHYILDEGEYDLTCAYAGQDKTTVALVFNDGDPVVNIPVEIKTTLFGTEDVSLDENGKTVSAYETVTLIDRVEYTGLVVGKEYTVTGTLMDKTTGESFKDADGNEITATETFTAETVDGYVDITFTFPGVLVSEKTTLVAFEKVKETETDKEVAVHTDIEDEDQTVTVEVPKIGTTAAIEGEKTACSTGKMTLTDIVAYENLVPGTYKLYTRVYDKTKGELTDWTGETVFEVTEKDGTVSVEIIISALDLTEDSEFVVFESLYRINKDEETGEETEEPVTDHENPDDEDQTFEILVPEIGTKATINDLKVVYANETMTLADVVAYKNLAPGKYVLRAEVYDKNAKELTGWTGELEFIVTEKDGEVTVEIEIDASTITEETSLVVFEYLFRLTDDEENPEEPVTEHEDEEDEDQTVTVEIPEVEVSKKAINGTEELPGAVLIIRDKDGKEIEKWTSTDETHTVTLPVGEYTLTELTAPKDYLVAETISFRVSVNDKNEVQVSVLEDEEYALQDGTLIEMFDAHKPEIEVSKKAINGTEELPGATLTIFDLEGKAVESWVSGEETHKVILEPGEYYLEEVTAPDGYLVAETIFFKVDTDRETGEYVLEIKVDDEYVKQDGTLIEMFDVHKPVVEISKKELNGTDELPGAELVLKDLDGNIVDKWTSGEESHEVTLNPGIYSLTELTAPEGYLVAETIIFRVTVDTESGETTLYIDVDGMFEKEDGTLIVMLDRHEPVMHTTVSANGKVSTDEKHSEIIQTADKTTVAVKDTVFYEFFNGGTYLLEGKLVKVEEDGKLIIVKEASAVVEAKEYEEGEWVLDFGELQLEEGMYVVFEKATPVTVEEKPNPEKPEETIEEITPIGEPISHENPEDESQTFVITNVPATGDSLEVIPYLLLLAVSGTGIVLLTKKRKTKA